MAKGSPTNPNFPVFPVILSALVLLLIGASFTIGMLWTKVQSLENGGGTGVAGPGTGNQPSAAPNPTVGEVLPLQEDDYVKGNRDAKVLLIEYSDFQCPFCQRFHPTAQQAVDEYGDDIGWVYRHFPLDQLHPRARKEAEAAECAAKQGGNDAFWAMGDAIFAKEPDITLDDLPTLAGELGLNVGEFTTCLDSGETAELVAADLESGTKAGIRGTPGNILLNTDTGESVSLPGAVPYTNLQTAIDQLLQQ